MVCATTPSSNPLRPNRPRSSPLVKSRRASKAIAALRAAPGSAKSAGSTDLCLLPNATWNNQLRYDELVAVQWREIGAKHDLTQHAHAERKGNSMRLATGLLILASIGALSQALATEP